MGKVLNGLAAPPLQIACTAQFATHSKFSGSIMTTSLKANLQDFDSLFQDIATSRIPAVSFVKPDALVDGHPGTSTPPLFEAMCDKIIAAVARNRNLWRDTAILITFDESGGWYDSGYIQPIDFFGDGPRTVTIAVCRYAKPGFVDHAYSDHASIVKFIEKTGSCLRYQREAATISPIRAQIPRHRLYRPTARQSVI